MDTKEDGGGEPSMRPTGAEAFLIHWSGEGLARVRDFLHQGEWEGAVRSADTYGLSTEDGPPSSRELKALLTDETVDIPHRARLLIADLIRRHDLAPSRDRPPIVDIDRARDRTERMWVLAVEAVEERPPRVLPLVAMLMDEATPMPELARIAVADLLHRYALKPKRHRPRAPFNVLPSRDAAMGLAQAVSIYYHFKRNPLAEPTPVGDAWARFLGFGRIGGDFGDVVLVPDPPECRRSTFSGAEPPDREAVWSSQMMGRDRSNTRRWAIPPEAIHEAVHKGGPRKSFRRLMGQIRRGQERAATLAKARRDRG